MAVPHIDSLLGALPKGPPLPRPHGTNWGVDHRQRHDGDAGKGFPLGGGGRPDHPLGGPPGLNRPDQVNFGNVLPPGIARPDAPQSGNAMPPGLDRPGLVPGNPAGGNHPAPGQVGTPGQSPVLDVAGPLPRQIPVGPGHHPHGPQPGPVQLPGPAVAMAGSQAQPMQLPAPAQAAPPHAQAAPGQTPAQAAQLPQQAQLPAAVPRADIARQAGMPPAQPGQAPRAEAPQALPPRAESVPVPRGEATAADRTGMLQRAAAGPMPLAAQAATVANQAAVSQAALTTAAAAGTTMATAPAATQAANQAADSRGVNPLIAADRAQVAARPDIAGTYTGEGPYRRGLRRAARALPGGLSTLLMALGAQGHAGASGRDPAAAERELRAALMQWLFWLLAVIAYGCLAFAVIGLLPPGSLGGAAPAAGGGRAWAGGFAIAGLVAGLGAWWFARGMARGTGAVEDDGVD